MTGIDGDKILATETGRRHVDMLGEFTNRGLTGTHLSFRRVHRVHFVDVAGYSHVNSGLAAKYLVDHIHLFQTRPS